MTVEAEPEDKRLAFVIKAKKNKRVEWDMMERNEIAPCTVTPSMCVCIFNWETFCLFVSLCSLVDGPMVVASQTDVGGPSSADKKKFLEERK